MDPAISEFCVVIVQVSVFTFANLDGFVLLVGVNGPGIEFSFMFVESDLRLCHIRRRSKHSKAP